MPDDERQHDPEDMPHDAAGDAAESEAAGFEERPDAEGDAAESEAAGAEAQGDAGGDAAEQQASEAEAAEREGDEAERRAAEAEVREAEEEEDEFGIDQKRMPFTEHLVELRYRIIVSMGAVAGVFIVLFMFSAVRGGLYEILTLPVKRACRMAGSVEFEQLLVSRTPTEMFVTSAYFCIIAAIALTIPVLLYQAWMFVAPGLKRKERRAVVPILSVGTVLFLMGVVFAYFVVVPVAFQFLMTYTQGFRGVKLLWNVGDTLKFESVLLLVFGFAFEMPLVITALTRVGIVSPDMLAKKRRYAILVMFVVGALLTPPDVFTQVCLAVPLVILFEISIIAARFFKPKRTIWEAWDESEDEDVLGKDWDDAVAEASAAASGVSEPTSGATPSEDTSPHESASEQDYYDHYGEYYDQGTYEDSMGDDLDYHHDEGGPAEQLPDEEAPPEGESEGEEPPAAEGPPEDTPPQ